MIAFQICIYSFQEKSQPEKHIYEIIQLETFKLVEIISKPRVTVLMDLNQIMEEHLEKNKLSV